MKRSRVILLTSLAVVLAVAAVWWSQRRSGFASPGECLDAYYEALLSGDAAKYEACLGDDLRAETRRRYASDAELGSALRMGAADLKNYVRQGDGTTDGADRKVTVEEVRASGVRRVRFRLRPGGDTWRIVGIDRGPETPAAVPYGTHVSKVPAGS
jgi:hypothetical protein